MRLRRRLSLFVLVVILALGFAVRLYKINNPVADWHSWRQADTAAVARNFVKFGFAPLRPRYDDLSNVQSGKENPQGYRMVEFPLYQTFGLAIYRVIPRISIEVSLRLVSIIFSLLSIIFIYKLVKKYSSETEALAASFFYTFLPYSIYYSRAILPEIMGVGLALGAVYFVDKSQERIKESHLRQGFGGQVKNLRIKEHFYFFLAAILSASALLVKPTTGFLLLPIAYLFYKHYGFKIFTSFSVYIYVLITLLPLILWRNWISKFPEGIPAYTWLLNGGNIRFTGAFFRWILAERLSKLILGYTGIFLLFLGLVTKNTKKTFLFASLLWGTILYVVVFARGNVQHDYYQILAIPVICIYLGKGVSFLLESKLISRLMGILVISLVTLFMLAFSWYEVRGYFWINHPEIVEAGKRVDVLVSKNAKVIAPYFGDTAFLYQTERQGWPVVEKPIPEMVKMGADYLVIVNPDKDALNLSKTYRILEKRDDYVIFSLK